MYTQSSLRSEIEQIYRNSDRLMWEQDATATSDVIDTVSRYCWVAYSKAYEANGVQVIGRIADLNLSLKAKVAGLVEGTTLLDTQTRGNILRMNKWCLVINDCWLLGGVHREAGFVLMSTASWKNLWNPEINGLVVTAREIIGLKTFGYERTAGTDKLVPGAPGTATYRCMDNSKARAADLEDYHLAAALIESRGPMGVTNLVI